MVDSSKGITNLHVPSDVIIDASMPAAIRSSGQMWGPDGKLHDMKAMIPDRCYAGIYQVTIDDCKAHGAFDVRTMGTVSNVGLMAQAAEEYGSHDKTFEIPSAGTVRVVDASGRVLTEHAVESGDVWRMCRTRDLPIRDWVKLAVNRARATGHAAIFWLDANRAYDRNVIERVQTYLKDHDTAGLDIRILAPVEAIARHARARARRPEHHLGHGQRAARLPDRPLPHPRARHQREDAVDRAAAGGRRPVRDRRRRLGAQARAAVRAGELPALGFARRVPGAGRLDRGPGRARPATPRPQVVADALDRANGRILENDKSPQRKVGELDNRGSHYYLAQYWARALADQDADAELKRVFTPIASELERQEPAIVAELNGVQGKPVDIGGYYHPDHELACPGDAPERHAERDHRRHRPLAAGSSHVQRPPPCSRA